MLETTRRLGRLRACSAALRKGSRDAFLVAKRTYGFTRVTPEEAVIVLISTDAEQAQIVPPLKAVLVISSELPELLGLCDRIYTLSEGRITGELPRHEATQERLMQLMTQTTTTGQE